MQISITLSEASLSNLLIHEFFESTDDLKFMLDPKPIFKLASSTFIEDLFKLLM